jgi:hypothetical protein
LTAIEDLVALEQGSQNCEEEAISFLKLNALKIDYNSALCIPGLTRHTTVY